MIRKGEIEKVRKEEDMVYVSGFQTFSVHRPLGSIYTPTAPPCLF
jgi:hypothetical protein